MAIWQGRAGGRTIAAASSLTEAGVDDLAAAGAVAVEDVDRGTYDDAVLFHLLNRAWSGARRFSSRRAALVSGQGSCPTSSSRLRAAHPAALAAPDEALLAQVLVKLFATGSSPSAR